MPSASIYKCSVCGEYVEEPVHCGRKALLLMDSRKRSRLSRLVSFILRHSPESIRVKIDSEGWVSIDELVFGIRNYWYRKENYQWVTREHILALAALDPKGRFEIRDNKIRARYGHNIALNVKIKYAEDTDTKILYHGTVRRNLENILKEGIKPIRRKYVHLTLNIEDACEVARRHGVDTVVLVVDAECLRRKRYRVYLASNTIRVVKQVPPECIVNVVECSMLRK